MCGWERGEGRREERGEERGWRGVTGLSGFICPTREARRVYDLNPNCILTFVNVNNITTNFMVCYVSVFFSRDPLCIRCFWVREVGSREGLLWHAWFGEREIWLRRALGDGPFFFGM